MYFLNDSESYDQNNKDFQDNWTHIKEIPNTGLLVSLGHRWKTSAGMEIFDISKKGSARRVYAFEEIMGSEYFFLYNV